MKIIDVEQLSYRKSIFSIECACTRRFRHRSGKELVKCPKCKADAELADLQEAWEREE